jgi:hypothetical protein
MDLRTGLEKVFFSVCSANCIWLQNLLMRFLPLNTVFSISSEERVNWFQIGTRVARWHIFKPKIPIWVIYGGSFALEDVSIFYGHNSIGILWPFVVFNGYLKYFPRFGMLYQEKSGNPDWLPVVFAIQTNTSRGWGRSEWQNSEDIFSSFSWMRLKLDGGIAETQTESNILEYVTLFLQKSNWLPGKCFLSFESYVWSTMFK